MTVPESPAGYTDYREYSFPRGLGVITALPLLAIASAFISSESILIIVESPVLNLICVGIAVPLFIFIHESIHYITASTFGYDPIYEWPTMVYVPQVSLPVRHMVSMLLAPQILSLAYAVLLLSGVNQTLQIIMGLGLLLNLGSSSSDVLWAIRRVTWPTGTKVVVGEDLANYVAFPKDAV
ncbi:metalloprotease family protein [Halobaculum litoreum]|uniref:Metalloprotease family protein n=1 Tax=Halobaculum litoreum TaxID=3031998 RepID=A0ABD5Y0R1_9EURY